MLRCLDYRNTAIIAGDSGIINHASFLHQTIPNVDLSFERAPIQNSRTLPVIRNKSETPVQKYLRRLRLDGLLGDIDKRMMSYF